MSLPTGSGITRAWECPASCALARADHQGAGAVYGQENHAEIEAGDLSRPVVRRVLEGAIHVRHEVSYVLDLETRTVREIGVNLQRAYGQLSPSEIALTIDIELQNDGVWWVGDWKSRGRVPAAAKNWQIKAGAIAVATRHGADAVIGFVGYLDDSELDTAHFDAFDIAGWWDDLRAMRVRIAQAEARHAEGQELNVSAGSWCQYCPAMPYCPAHTRLARSLLGELDTIEERFEALSKEQCGRAWDTLKRYKTVAERIEASIRERARREPIPLSNGRHLALVDSKRTSLDTKKAAAMLGDEAPYKTTHYTQVRETRLADDASDGGDDDGRPEQGDAARESRG